MSTTADILIALLRSAVTGTDENIDLEGTDYEALFALSDFHDLAHIVCHELTRRGCLPQDNLRPKWQYRYDMALFRHTRREVALTEIREVLEEAHIPFILLKGAVLMNLYPEPWMRTSSDIDVLVQKKDLQQAAACFQKAGMIREDMSTHDISFVSPEQYHIELHYTLLEDFVLAESAALLQNVWDHVLPKKESTAEFQLNDAAFYFFHIAHMAKHIKRGGTGIRAFLDLWLLDHRVPFDAEQRAVWIGQGGLSAFEKHAKALSEVWFSAEETDIPLDELKQYILYGGLYGTFARRIAIQKKKAGNRFSYYLGRLFLPYRHMKHAYPVLKKYPILLPFFWIVRWFKLLRPSVRRQTAEEIKAGRAADNLKNERTEMLLKQLEIW